MWEGEREVRQKRGVCEGCERNVVMRENVEVVDRSGGDSSL